jgi:ferric-dicitrate binding protein FerR (iron transport regulator)
MDEKKSYFYNLMVRYFQGETSPEELDRLSVWLSEDPMNRTLFEEHHQTWKLLAKDSISSADIDKEWEAFSSRLSNSVKLPDLNNHAFPTETSTVPISRKQRPGIIRMISSWRVAASLVIIVISAAILYYLIATPAMTEVYAENSNIEHVLPDGSVVTLYKGSKIGYPASFVKETRNVTLEGEANFIVQHDKKHPFIVSGNNLRVMVLGTEFNVNTKAGEGEINVVLESGTVSLFFKGNESENLILKPGEAAFINTNEKSMQKSVNTNPNYNAWLTGNIVFNNTRLEEVAEILAKVYHVEIELDENLKDCTLTATFEKQSFDQVINVISETLGIKDSRQKDNIIYLDGNCQ